MHGLDEVPEADMGVWRVRRHRGEQRHLCSLRKERKMDSWVVLFIIWIGCGAWASTIAKQRGNDGSTGFSLGILLGPIGILIAAVMPVNPNGQGKVQCPHCKEWIDKTATVCSHCQRNLPGKEINWQK